MMEASEVWGAIFLVYVLGGSWWTGFFDYTPRPKTHFEDSTILDVWEAENAKRQSRMLIWVIGLVILLVVWWSFT